VADPSKTRKKRLSSECAVSVLSHRSDAANHKATPPPLKNARRAAAAGHKTTQRRRQPPVRRRTALIWGLMSETL